MQPCFFFIIYKVKEANLDFSQGTVRVFGIKENNVISTNPFVLLVTRFAYYPVRIIKPLYLKKFSLTSMLSSNIIKAHLSK